MALVWILCMKVIAWVSVSTGMKEKAKQNKKTTVKKHEWIIFWNLPLKSLEPFHNLCMTINIVHRLFSSGFEWSWKFLHGCQWINVLFLFLFCLFLFLAEYDKVIARAFINEMPLSNKARVPHCKSLTECFPPRLMAQTWAKTPRGKTRNRKLTVRTETTR